MNKYRIKARAITLFSCLALSQAVLWAQNSHKISITKNSLTLKEALHEVEKQAKISIAYNESQLGANKTISLNLTNASLDAAMKQILQDTGFSYRVEGNYIILSPLEKKGKVKKITGHILDDRNEPMIGVNVMVKGKPGVGTITNIDGNFSLEVTEGDILEISYVGYASQSVKIMANNEYNVQLKPDAETLEEVVVTALGIKRSQKALSYNVQEVKGDVVTTVKDANFMNSLAGKVAGVQINSSSAGAGGAVRVVMRGTKSLVKDDNALYVIDGVPMFNVESVSDKGGTMSEQPGTNGVADINPEDIESMSILTGPSAAALYGSSASNGVVLITTKKGTVGKAKLSYSNSTTFSTPIQLLKFQNTYGNVSGNNTSWGNKLATPTDFDPSCFFNTGVNEINALTFTTGIEKNQTYASVASTNSTGILPNNSYNRYNFSIRNTSRFLNDKLTLDIGAQYIIQNNKNMVGGGEYYNPLVSLYLFPRGEDFQEVQMFERYDMARNIMVQYWPTEIYGSSLSMQNPYWIMNRMNNLSSKRRYIYNASLKWDINSWMNITGRVKVDNSDMDSYKKFYASTNATFTEGSNKGFYKHVKQNDRSVYSDVILNISKNVMEDRMSINVNLGGSLNDTRSDMFLYSGGLDKIPNFFHVGNIAANISKRNETMWHDQIQSLFFSGELGWNHMLYLTLTGRNDWDSRLAYTSKDSYFYPSIGLSAVVSEMVNLPEFISYLKIRGSWAEVASAPERYLTIMQYEYDEQTGQYVYPSIHYNTDLKPENTKSWELGINAKFWGNRINLDATWYRSNTFNQTFYVDASASSGYDQNIVQTGNIQNQGLELALGYTDTYGKDWRFSTNFTYTFNKNKVISLANGAINPDTNEPIQMDYLSKGTLGIGGGPTIRLTEGGTMGDLYTNQRLRQSPNGYIWVSPMNEVALETTEYKKIGSVLPKFHLGWSGNIGWKDLNLNFSFSGRFGGIVVSDTQALLDRYGVSKQTADVRDAGGVAINGGVIPAKNYYEQVSNAIGTYYTYSATNIRLSELSLSYSLPKKWFNDKLAMSVGVTGKNLWLIYCKAPFDPENTSSTTNNFYQGVDYFMQPSTRNIGFNVKLSF